MVNYPKSVSTILMVLLCIYFGCSKKEQDQPQYATRSELETAITVAFHAYGVIGAQVHEDSNLMLMYVKGDFLKTYTQNEDEMNQLFRTWLDRYYRFKGKKEAVGILVRKGQQDLFHASRDRDGNVYFRRI
jgi:hypothetical protein